MLEVDLRQAALELPDLPGQLMIRLAQCVELGRVCRLRGAQRGPLLGELVLCARTRRVSYRSSVPKEIRGQLTSIIGVILTCGASRTNSCTRYSASGSRINSRSSGCKHAWS